MYVYIYVLGISICMYVCMNVSETMVVMWANSLLYIYTCTPQKTRLAAPELRLKQTWAPIIRWQTRKQSRARGTEFVADMLVGD